MLQRVEVGPVVWYQVVLVKCLELHRGVLLILGGCVALVMEMVGSGWVDNSGLLGLPLAALAVHVNHER